MYSHSDIEIAKRIKSNANFETVKEPRKKTAKSKPISKSVKDKLEMDKDSLLKIRSNLQSVLNKIKR
jgi:hypothetical protein